MNLYDITQQRHKLNNRSSIYMDELLYNHQLSTKVAYKECKFLYILREPEPVLNFLVVREKRKLPFAARYYTYRLRRLYEMAKRTPGAVLLTWDDLIANRGISLLEEYLGLRSPIQFNPALLDPLNLHMDLAGRNVLSETENTYQKYLYFLKNQSLQYWT